MPDLEGATGNFRAVLRELREAEHQLDALYEYVKSYPKWAWIKRYDSFDDMYYMLAFSRQYGKDIVGPDYAAYVGKHDYDFWPHQVAQIFHENDTLVRLNSLNPATPNAADVKEYFHSVNTGLKGYFVGTKWAFGVAGQIYVAGSGHGELDNAAQIIGSSGSA